MGLLVISVKVGEPTTLRAITTQRPFCVYEYLTLLEEKSGKGLFVWCPGKRYSQRFTLAKGETATLEFFGHPFKVTNNGRKSGKISLCFDAPDYIGIQRYGFIGSLRKGV